MSDDAVIDYERALRSWLVGQILPRLISPDTCPTDEVDVTFRLTIAEEVAKAIVYADEAIKQLRQEIGR